MYEVNEYSVAENNYDNTNTALIFGGEIYNWVNPKYCKLVFKINGSGNLVVESTPSLTPGTLPEGVNAGRIPAGTKVFDYTKKILFSITFDDCINISEMSKKRFDYDETGHQIKPSTISPVVLYRNSNKFNKKMTISYVDGGNGYYVNMIFESVDTSGITNKFSLPINLESFDMLAKLFETYANNFFIIQYYNQVSKGLDEKINKLLNK